MTMKDQPQNVAVCENLIWEETIWAFCQTFIAQTKKVQLVKVGAEERIICYSEMKWDNNILAPKRQKK